jgi:hypothetical protein
MIPETVFNYLATMREAAKQGELALAASTLAATGEPLALIIAINKDDDHVDLLPLALLAKTGTIENGQLTDSAKEAFNTFHADLLNEKQVVWFHGADASRIGMSHVTQGYKPIPRINKPQVILPWDDPYKLFTPPIPSIPERTHDAAPHLH